MARDLAEEGASEEEQMNCYRKVRDEIKAFVETLPEALKRQLKSEFPSDPKIDMKEAYG